MYCIVGQFAKTTKFAKFFFIVCKTTEQNCLAQLSWHHLQSSVSRLLSLVALLLSTVLSLVSCLQSPVGCFLSTDTCLQCYVSFLLSRPVLTLFSCFLSPVSCLTHLLSRVLYPVSLFLPYLMSPV